MQGKTCFAHKFLILNVQCFEVWAMEYISSTQKDVKLCHGKMLLLLETHICNFCNRKIFGSQNGLTSIKI